MERAIQTIVRNALCAKGVGGDHYFHNQWNYPVVLTPDSVKINYIFHTVKRYIQRHGVPRLQPTS
jgi:hypothetical protein